MRKIQQNGQKHMGVYFIKTAKTIFHKLWESAWNATCELFLTGADDDGVDDNEENVGEEDDIKRHTIHLLSPSVEPVDLGILFRNTFLHATSWDT